MQVQQISFQGKPLNYSVIDKYVSRSGQPKKEDFKWLQERGVTDIINFRSMKDPTDLKFDEPGIVKSLGMNYHQIPSTSSAPDEKSVFNFLELINKLTDRKAKIHIHCRHGADRTGLYSFIYKAFRNIGTTAENIDEWIAKGLNLEKYPDLISWGVNFVNKYKNKIIKS